MNNSELLEWIIDVLNKYGHNIEYHYASSGKDRFRMYIDRIDDQCFKTKDASKAHMTLHALMDQFLGE